LRRGCGGWGLEEYEPAFRDNRVDAEVLPDLTEAHLASLGLPLGPRLKLLKAIAALHEGAMPARAPDTPSDAPLPPATHPSAAERRAISSARQRCRSGSTRRICGR
jgi:hypothetical protein